MQLQALKTSKNVPIKSKSSGRPEHACATVNENEAHTARGAPVGDGLAGGDHRGGAVGHAAGLSVDGEGGVVLEHHDDRIPHLGVQGGAQRAHVLLRCAALLGGLAGWRGGGVEGGQARGECELVGCLLLLLLLLLLLRGLVQVQHQHQLHCAFDDGAHVQCATQPSRCKQTEPHTRRQDLPLQHLQIFTQPPTSPPNHPRTLNVRSVYSLNSAFLYLRPAPAVTYSSSCSPNGVPLHRLLPVGA